MQLFSLTVNNQFLQGNVATDFRGGGTFNFRLFR